MRYATFQQEGPLTEKYHSREETIGGRQVRFGGTLLIITEDADWEDVASHAQRSGIDLTKSKKIPDAESIYLVRQKGRLFETAFPTVQIIHDSGRFLAVRMNTEEYSQATRHDSFCFEISPLPASDIVFERLQPRPSSRLAPNWVHALVEDVSMDAYRDILEELVSYPTRHTMSLHYTSAADLCRSRLIDLGYQTRIQTVPLSTGDTLNVIGEKHGAKATDKKLVIAMAHLDSINIQGEPSSDAPGADDNASGSAAIIEIARVLQHHVAEHDLQLVLFGGEELGLYGSRHYVSELDESERRRILAVLNMDMIAGQNLEVPTVLIEAREREIIDTLVEAANTFSGLRVETSLHPFASDHIPFIEAGLPAAMTIEGADARNDNIHTAHDTLEHINTELACEVLRMNLGFIAEQLGTMR